MKRLVEMASAIGLTMIFLMSIFSTGALACDFSNTIYECEYELLAGQYTDVGKIVIWDVRDTDGNHDLYIKYVVDEPCWYLEEAHLGFAWHDGGDTYEWDDYDWGKMVTQKGSPKVGKLQYSKDDFDMDTTWTVGPIDISDITLGNNLACGDLAIAAHAVVYKKCGDCITQKETAWGEGIKFGKSWAMFMKFPCCGKDPDFIEEAQIKGIHPGPESYWEFEFSFTEPDDYNDFYLGDGDKLPAWCMQKYVYMTPGTPYTANLIRYDDPLNTYESDYWPEICYVINHKWSWVDSGGNVKINDVQQAIHWLMGENVGKNYIAQEALALGAGYEVPRGGVIPIILLIDEDTQGCFIELDP